MFATSIYKSARLFHPSLQALANILTAVQKGVTVVDSSTAGLGGGTLAFITTLGRTFFYCYLTPYFRLSVR